MSSNLYERLGVDKKAGAADIKRAHQRLVKTHHPDKGGDAEEFKKIQQAYEVLMDSEKRRMYDMTGAIPGEEPPMQEMNMGAGMPGMPFGVPFPFNMADLFPGGGRPKQGPIKKGYKGPPKVDRLPLSLEQFYYGHTIQMSFDRMKICTDCRGSGAAEKESCGECGGQGQISRTMMMGHMVMQTVGPCTGCNGEGMKTRRACEPCGGTGRVKELRQLEVAIEPGMNPGDQLKFSEACSETLEYDVAGDVIIILDEAESAAGWVRRGADLHQTIVIGLADSLCGCVHTVDDHPKVREGEEVVRVRVPAGVVTGDVLKIEAYGMPMKGGGGYGAMILTVRVMISEDERDVVAGKGRSGLLEMFGRTESDVAALGATLLGI
jgi:DnaJ-class molecular chaperone